MDFNNSNNNNPDRNSNARNNNNVFNLNNNSSFNQLPPSNSLFEMRSPFNTINMNSQHQFNLHDYSAANNYATLNNPTNFSLNNSNNNQFLLNSLLSGNNLSNSTPITPLQHNNNHPLSLSNLHSNNNNNGNVLTTNNSYVLKQHQLSRQNSSMHYRSKVALANMKINSNIIGDKEFKNNINKDTSINISNDENIIIEDYDKDAEKEKDVDLWTQLDIGGVGVKSLSESIFQYDFLTHLYINHNNLVYLSDEIIMLKNLVKLDVSGNKLIELPSNIGKLVKMKEILAFDNSIVYLPISIGSMFRLKFLGLDGNPLNEPIKSILENQGTVATIKYIRDNAEAPNPPKSRRWAAIVDQKSIGSTNSINTNNSFKVMSYNILSEKYATANQYGYTPEWCLDWEYRKDLIMQEILSYQAEIICLQEIEAGQFEKFFMPRLKIMNYGGVFWSKTRAKLMQADKEKSRVDGCATFYKLNSSVAMLNKDFVKTDDLFNRFLNKDNVAGITILKDLMIKGNSNLEQQNLIIGNVHLHWDPEYCDVKVLQASMLTKEIEKIKITHNINKIIICGDFNSLPDSGVCQFLNNGHISNTHKDLKNFQYGKYTENGLEHNLKLKSVYSKNDMLCTNFTPGFTGTIDYIWYTPYNLKATGILGDIDYEYALELVGFPSAHFPSEYFCIKLIINSL